MIKKFSFTLPCRTASPADDRPRRETSYEIEESKAIRDGLCETRAAFKQSTETLRLAQQNLQQLQAEILEQQLRQVGDLVCMVQRMTGTHHSQMGFLQNAQKEKTQRLAKQLEDKNVQVRRMRWVPIFAFASLDGWVFSIVISNLSQGLQAILSIDFRMIGHSLLDILLNTSSAMSHF